MNQELGVKLQTIFLIPEEGVFFSRVPQRHKVESLAINRRIPREVQRIEFGEHVAVPVKPLGASFISNSTGRHQSHKFRVLLGVFQHQIAACQDDLEHRLLAFLHSEINHWEKGYVVHAQAKENIAVFEILTNL